MCQALKYKKTRYMTWQGLSWQENVGFIGIGMTAERMKCESSPRESVNRMRKEQKVEPRGTPTIAEGR